MSFSNFVFSIDLGDVKNGSASINKDTEEIIYNVVDVVGVTNPGNGADDFEIVSNTPSFTLQAKQSAAVGTTYSLQIEAFDANGNGLSTKSTAFLVGVNP